jgi:hypothetical protein
VIRAALAALLVAVVLGACIGGDPDCAALPTRIELTLSADELRPSSPAVCRGRDVTLVVTSEVDGVLHIHGYDDDVPATEVAAGEVTELAFTARRSGQFPIELHTDENTQGVALGVFTVHEP